MSNKIPNGCTIVVADGTQAAFFTNTSSSGELSLKAKEKVTSTDLTQDGPSGKMPAEMSNADLEEATFAKQLTHRLNTMAESGKIQQLVLAADPTTLGQMREMMSKKLSDCVIKELPKTLTTSSVEDIERSLNND